MCGIVGIIGREPVAQRLVDALKRLEYRGYDSAGVATLENGVLERCRAPGKLVNLEKKLLEFPLSGTIGIGHTRWATHGAPTENNAHPHFCGNIGVVHNGIIENFSSLREELRGHGHVFTTDTDTEVICQLLDRHMNAGEDFETAVSSVLKRLVGAYAIAILISGVEDKIVAARQGPPLAIGYGEGEMFIGSDAIALSPFTDEVSYLEDGDWAVVSHEDVVIRDASGALVERPKTTSSNTTYIVDKGNYRHYMEKEIYEQPEVVSRAVSHYVDFNLGAIRQLDNDIDYSKLDRLAISACGTAYYSGLVAKYWFEKYARLPVEIDVASEFRYREMPLSKDCAALFISQSGETADTLACLRYCKEQGLKIGAVVNVSDSTIARESDVIYPTLAGPEIGVASTKAFTCQLTVLATLAIKAGVQRGFIDKTREQQLVKDLCGLPRVMGQVAHEIQSKIEELSRQLSVYSNVLYLGRGTNFPLALEGALKLKEISYIHAEGYAAGELKHGPIALIDENMPVIVIAPHDNLYEKTISNMQEVGARGGQIILITDEKGAKADMDLMETIILPKVPELITPILYSIPVQLLAYHTAVFMGTDVDQPRNLAKSVTVE